MKQRFPELLTRLLLHTWLLLLLFYPDVSYSMAVAPALIAAGATVAAAAGQSIATGKLNKKNRQWQEKMYATQRNDALADWNMQNAYNSPEQQMQRLQDAGLNPNLVYGDGNVQGNSSADVRSSQPGSPSTTAPDYSGVGQGIMSYVDMKAKTAQTDNLKAQNDLLQEQVRSEKMNNASKAMTYIMEAQAKNATNDAVAQTAMARAKAELYKLSGEGNLLDVQHGNVSQDTLNKQKTGLYIDQQISTENVKRDIMRDENTRAWIMNSSNVREAAARIGSMMYANAKSDADRRYIEANIAGQGSDNVMKELDAFIYKKYGVRPGEGLQQGGWKQGNIIMKSITDFLKEKLHGR